mgnify:CR=1 FL=1
MAEGDGATRIEGRIVAVDLDGASGDIAALRLAADESDIEVEIHCFGKAKAFGEAGGVDVHHHVH